MYDLVIIGAGPAGLSASVYAKRAGLDAITLEAKPISGGQVMSTYEVDNYLGYHGISGMELCNRFREHADALECKFATDEAKNIIKLEGGYIVEGETNSYKTRGIIMAMGAEHRTLGVPGEEELVGCGVSYCATCDGAFFKDKTVAVIGGGDVAVEDAIYLARTSKKVYLIHRRDSLRAAKMLSDKLQSLPNVEMVWNSVVDEIIGEDQVEGIAVTDVVTKENRRIEVDGVFIAVGINPINALAKGLADLDENGYVMSGDQCITKTPGLFVAGDLRTKKLRQIITAVADGANAVNSAEAYLNKLK